jgi:hypothetical protein
MKRPTICIALILLTAAVVNQLVAFGCCQFAREPWGCRLPSPDNVLRAATFPPGTPTAPSQITARFVAKASSQWGWPKQVYESDVWDDVGFKSSTYAATVYELWNGPRIDYFEAGWPFICFDGALATGSGGSGQVSLGGMIQLDRWYPMSPKWAFLLLNVAIYGFAIVTLQKAALFSISRVRTWLFFEPGLCSKCGYDLRGGAHAKCPECGHSLGEQVTAP